MLTPRGEKEYSTVQYRNSLRQPVKYHPHRIRPALSIGSGMWRKQHVEAAAFLERACERAIAMTCSDFAPPCTVANFLSAGPVAAILGSGDDSISELFNQRDIQKTDNLEASTLMNIIADSQNMLLLAAVRLRLLRRHRQRVGHRAG